MHEFVCNKIGARERVQAHVRALFIRAGSHSRERGTRESQLVGAERLPYKELRHVRAGETISKSHTIVTLSVTKFINKIMFFFIATTDIFSHEKNGNTKARRRTQIWRVWTTFSGF